MRLFSRILEALAALPVLVVVLLLERLGRRPRTMYVSEQWIREHINE